jgi:hypothetical protein
MDRRDEAHRRISRPVNTHGGLRMLFLFGFEYFNVAFSIYVSTCFFPSLMPSTMVMIDIYLYRSVVKECLL